MPEETNTTLAPTRICGQGLGNTRDTYALKELGLTLQDALAKGIDLGVDAANLRRARRKARLQHRSL